MSRRPHRPPPCEPLEPRRLLAAAPVGDAFEVGPADEVQAMPAVGVDPDGDFAVTWTGYALNMFGIETDRDIFMQRFTSAGVSAGGEARVTVNFKNFDKPTRLVYVLSRTATGWRISDIRYDDGSSLKKILEGKL